MDNNNLNENYQETTGPIFDGETLPTDAEIYQYEQETAETKKGRKKGKKPANPSLSALIIGIIFMIVNSIMCCASLNYGFLFGGIFIIFPVAGIVNAVQGLKEGGNKVQCIIGLVCNIIGGIEALILIVLGIVGKFLG